MNTCSVIFKMSEIDSNYFIIYRTYQNQRQGALLNKYNWTHSTTCSVYQSYQHLLQMISALPLVEIIILSNHQGIIFQYQGDYQIVYQDKYFSVKDPFFQHLFQQYIKSGENQEIIKEKDKVLKK